jgi:hypothetical protein
MHRWVQVTEKVAKEIEEGEIARGSGYYYFDEVRRKRWWSSMLMLVTNYYYWAMELGTLAGT